MQSGIKIIHYCISKKLILLNIFITTVISFIIFFVNYKFIIHKIYIYYNLNNNILLDHTSYSEADTYEDALDICENIYNFANNVEGYFIAYEIWDKRNLYVNNYPIFMKNNMNISEYRLAILKSLNNNAKHFFILNKDLYIGIIIQVRSENIKNYSINNSNIFDVVFYRKIYDLEYYNYLGFVIKQILIFMSVFLFVLINFIIFCKYQLKREKIYEGIIFFHFRNLIEHALVNQSLVLGKSENFKEVIARALYYNEEARLLLKNFQLESFSLNKFIEYFKHKIFLPEEIKISYEVNIKTYVFFNSELLFLTLSSIINNASHNSVQAKNIRVSAYQKNEKSLIHIKISNDGKLIPISIRNKIFSGISTKPDGSGKNLKNLSDIFKLLGIKLQLLNSNETTFYFAIKPNAAKLEDYNFLIVNISLQTKHMAYNQYPLVVIIEDEKLIWDVWKYKMTDAQLMFFCNPDEFFIYVDEQKLLNNHIISKIDMIISDYDYGNGTNFVTSCFLNTLDHETDVFVGKIILTSGHNESVLENIPTQIRKRLHLVFQKRPCQYESILRKIYDNKIKNI